MSRTIQSLAEKAGIAEVGVTPHYFRHVFATRALDRTENLALVQDMLGHASPATTRVYARTDERQRREGYARVWGEGEVGNHGGTEGTEEEGERFEAAVPVLDAVRDQPPIESPPYTPTGGRKRSPPLSERGRVGVGASCSTRPPSVPPVHPTGGGRGPRPCQNGGGLGWGPLA